MDEPDYKDTRSTFDSFKARKEMLRGYTELTVEDINNVVDFKLDLTFQEFKDHSVNMVQYSD